MTDSYYSDGSALIADPSNPSIYWSGGIYNSGNYYFSVGRSTDSGASWSHTQFGNPGGSLLCMTLDPAHPDTVYAGGYEGSAAAVYRTLDGGGNWSKVSAPGLSGQVNALAVCPSNPSLILAATTTGIYRSTDFGSSFARVAASVSSGKDLLFDPVDSQHVWAATSGQGVWHSSDGGAIWSAMNSGLEVQSMSRLAVNPGSWLFAGTTCGAAWRWNMGTGVENPESGLMPRPGSVRAVPNPADQGAEIHYSASSGGVVQVRIFDASGRLVESRTETPDSQGDAWFWWSAISSDGGRLEPGVYLVTAESADGFSSGRLVLTR